jgi:hypothetical protein
MEVRALHGARDQEGHMTYVLKLAGAALVAGAFLVPSAACTTNPTITAFIDSQECPGGLIHVNGSGFTPNGEVEVEILGNWNTSGWWDLGGMKADAKGNLSNFTYLFGYAPAGGGPECNNWTAQDNVVSVMAKDLNAPGGQPSLTFTNLGMAQCTAHAGGCW